MSWNRSDTMSTTSKKSSRGAGKSVAALGRFSHLGLLAGIIVVLASLVAWLVLMPSGEKPAEKVPKAPKQVEKTVTAPVPVKKVSKAPDPNKVYWHGQEFPRFNERGGEAYITGYGVRYHTPNVITNTGSASRRMPWDVKPFKYSTDRTIAVLINTEPGTGFVGTRPFDESFTKNFLKSLEEPIEILPDDSEAVKQLKKDVIATRADLKARHDKGEDIAKIVTDTQEELRQLGAYRQELQEQVMKLAQENTYTEKELDDLESAANEMLQKRGCSKLTMPEFLRRGSMLRAMRANESK